MERRIKTLYIITIVAILAFLGVQTYWLYTRYEYSLTEHENQTYSRILDLLDEYRSGRAEQTDRIPGQTRQTSYNVDMISDMKSDTLSHRIKVQSIVYNAYDLLGLPKDHILTDEDKQKIQDLLLTDEKKGIDNTIRTFDTQNAPNDASIWSASRNVDLEAQNPFTVVGIDTLLTAAGINADIRLTTADSMIWQNRLERHTSSVRPTFKVVHPYSELELKIVEISCPIKISAVIAGMTDILVIAAAISALLIVCLLWQFSTILKQNRLDKMRNDFVLSMIHELKRPLSTLKMCVSGIENDAMMADRSVRHELMTSTRDALDNLSAYFSRLRDISFNTVDQIPLNTTHFRLSEVIGKIRDRISVPAGKNVSISNSCPPDMEITADRIHIYNILNNLIENSIKYSGKNVTVDIHCRTNAGNCMISVSDTGYGMSATDCEKVFDRFFRSQSAIDSDQPGMGLGLSYVRLLVEAHGGSIDVSSRKGKGSCFTITLPQ